jgi:ankyrin repeat protein
MGNSASASASSSEKQDDELSLSLMESAMTGDLPTIQAAADAYILIEKEKEEGGQHELTTFFNRQDGAGNALIHGAVFGGHLNVVKYLATNGGASTLSLPNKLGCSPLWLAAGYNHLSILEFLLLSKNNLDKEQAEAFTLLATNSTGDTPLLAAASKGHSQICKTLMEHAERKGFAVAEKLKCMTNKSKDSALSIAIGAGIGEQVFDLLSHESVVNLVNTKGVTPLLIACERDFPAMVRKLIDAGVSVVDSKDVTSGDSALAVAAFCGSKDVVELLVVKQGDYDEKQQLELQQLLNGASSKSGCTPLWLATRAGHVDCVRLLLEAGADVTAANKDGFTPLQAAVKYKRQDMVELLTEYEQKNN